MRIGAQPPRRRGTVGRPYSALNLRLALAAFGLVFCAGFAVVMARAGATAFAWFLAVLALVAAADMVVIQLRRRARRREGGDSGSLFE
jgi:hypothetical protein